MNGSTTLVMKNGAQHRQKQPIMTASVFAALVSMRMRLLDMGACSKEAEHVMVLRRYCSCGSEQVDDLAGIMGAVPVTGAEPARWRFSICRTWVMAVT